MSSNFAQISATANVKNQPAKLKGIFCSSATSSPTITIYDTQTTGTTVKVIDTFVMTAATNYNFYDGISTENGLYAVISGTASVTVYYE
jgi:hypothetical protein